VTPEGLQEHFYFGGGSSTNITPLGICILVLACLLILFLKRKWMLAPFVSVTLLMPIGQVIVVLGAHLSIWRFLILVAWIRVSWIAFITKKDPFPGPLNLLDKLFVSWAVCNAIVYTILWSDTGALFNRFGFLYSSVGTYFLFRYLIRDRDDIIRAIRLLALVAVPVAVVMATEHFTGHNQFAKLGGVDELSNIRNGRVRAQGPFLHAIVAGTFGAVLLPLFVALWLEGKGNRLRAACGVLSSAVIAITAASSTPLIAFAAAVVGLCFWPLRRSLRVVRWVAVFMLVALQLAMKVPIWFLMNRIGAVIGGTGWHRAELIDQFVRRFFEWFLIGTRTNANWGLDMWDSINAYVRAGVEGGLITLIFFLSILIVGFKRIGRARKLSENEKDSGKERLLFAMGAALFSNCVAFLGIIYFDQSAVAWYLTLVMISVMTALVLGENREAQPAIAVPLARRFAHLNTPKHPGSVSPVQQYSGRLKP
jgi:hypothetical protein